MKLFLQAPVFCVVVADQAKVCALFGQLHVHADSLSVRVWLGLEQRRFSGIPLKSGSDHVYAPVRWNAMGFLAGKVMRMTRAL